MRLCHTPITRQQEAAPHILNRGRRHFVCTAKVVDRRSRAAALENRQAAAQQTKARKASSAPRLRTAHRTLDVCMQRSVISQFGLLGSLYVKEGADTAVAQGRRTRKYAQRMHFNRPCGAKVNGWKKVAPHASWREVTNVKLGPLRTLISRAVARLTGPCSLNITRSYVWRRNRSVCAADRGFR